MCAQVHAGRAVEVVQAVGVLELGELQLEHVVKRAAEQASEEVGVLGEAADPQVDIVESGDVDRAGVCPCAGAEHEICSVIGGDIAECWVHDGACCVALTDGGGLSHDRGVCAVGGHEVDQRLRVLEVCTKIDPVGVGGELTVVGLSEDLAANVVERGDAFAAGTSQVQRGEVERQAEQVVAQRVAHELVELVAHLIRQAHHDCPRTSVAHVVASGCKFAGSDVLEFRRVQEAIEESDVILGSVNVGAGDRLVEH